MDSLELEDKVIDVVQDFMNRGVLFTALDVSNEVKKTDPTVRHKSVREVVRTTFQSYMEPQGWTRTPITVILSDGTKADALLYHDIGSSWDLDNKYSAQQRTQTSTQMTTNAIQISTTPAAIPVATVSQTTPCIPPFATARTMWDNLFQTQPSLFPVK